MADLHNYSLIYPLSRYIRITQIFWAQHLGIDFGWLSGYSNQDIVAIADGTVVDLADGWGNTYPTKRIYGNYVILDHGGGVFSLYGHLLTGVKSYVRVGQKVKQGQTVGRMGNSGFSAGQHLHFELRNGGNSKAYSIDPISWLVVKDRDIYINPESKEYNRIRTEYGPVDPVDRNTAVDQIEVQIKNLRCRKEPSLNGEILGLLDPGYYNLYGTEEADGFVWYKIGEERWCAKVTGVVSLPASKQTLYDIAITGVSKGDAAAIKQLCTDLALDCQIRAHTD